MAHSLLDESGVIEKNIMFDKGERKQEGSGQASITLLFGPVFEARDSFSYRKKKILESSEQTAAFWVGVPSGNGKAAARMKPQEEAL